MKHEEKVDLVIDAIIDAQKFTLANHMTNLYITSENRLLEFFPQDLNIILIKLENEENVIKTDGIGEFSSPDRDVTDAMYYPIEVLDSFQEWQHQYRAKRNTLQFDSIETTDPNIPGSEIALRITYTKSREILVDDKFQIGKPDFDGENDLVFEFLYKHPNQKYSVSQIENELNISLSKGFDKIVENLGFRGDFRKAFFNVSKSAILFRNPITKHDLEELGISRIKMR